MHVFVYMCILHLHFAHVNMDTFFFLFIKSRHLPACRCDERTTAGCEMGSGRCICKPQFAGENCDRCADGHYYYPDCFRKFSFALTRWDNILHKCAKCMILVLHVQKSQGINLSAVAANNKKVELVIPVPHLSLDLKGRLCFFIEGYDYSWSVNLNPIFNSWNHESTLFYSQISPWTNTFVQSLLTEVHLAEVHL